MRELIEFLVKEISGSDNFSVAESADGDRLDYTIYGKPGELGLIIGKGGKTIRAIRNLVKVRAMLEKKVVVLSVAEKE